jgi:transcriptional regulator GlxA family with amidase domain
MARNPAFDVLKHFRHPSPLKAPISAHDQKLLDCFREAVERHQSDPEFTTVVAAASVGLSRMHLNRKLRALTGRSTHEYIQGMRLEEARALLSQPLSVASIARSCGFKNGSHFARVFRERFGVAPSAYRANKSLARQPTLKKPPK